MILVYGFGNPGRRDDGLGPALIERLERLGIPGVSADSNYQLQVEDAEAVSRCEAVIFADASTEGAEPFSFSEIEPSAVISFTTHTVSPESILALAHELYGVRVKGYVLAIRGYEWDFTEGLSSRAAENLERALQFTAATVEKMIRHDGGGMNQCIRFAPGDIHSCN